MKTDRRHELQTNVLADWLGKQIERARPYARALAGVLLAAAVILGVYTYLSAQSNRQNAKGWDEYDRALYSGNIEKLVEIADASEYQQTAVGTWAKLTVADNKLGNGVSHLFDDRAAANAELREALGKYTQVAAQAELPLLAQRATLGMARAYECLNELDRARSTYQKVRETWPNTPAAAEAEMRLTALENPSIKEFYDWFFAQSPRRPGLLGPGVPGARPDFGSVPEESTFRPPQTDATSAPIDLNPGAESKSDGEKPVVPPGSEKASSEPRSTKSPIDQ